MKQAGILLTMLLSLATTAQADEVLEYGEYLAGECFGCHQLYKSVKGLRKLGGWDKDIMIAVLHAYKSGEGDNDTMFQIAKKLDEEQINARAAYLMTTKK